MKKLTVVKSDSLTGLPNFIVYVKVAELDDTDYADSDSNSEDNLSTVEKVEDFRKLLTQI